MENFSDLTLFLAMVIKLHLKLLPFKMDILKRNSFLVKKIEIKKTKLVFLKVCLKKSNNLLAKLVCEE